MELFFYVQKVLQSLKSFFSSENAKGFSDAPRKVIFLLHYCSILPIFLSSCAKLLHDLLAVSGEDAPPPPPPRRRDRWSPRADPESPPPSAPVPKTAWRLTYLEVGHTQ